MAGHKSSENGFGRVGLLGGVAALAAAGLVVWLSSGPAPDDAARQAAMAPALDTSTETGSGVSLIGAAHAATAADVATSAALGRPGDMVLGSADAPVEMIEYASMTCGHCAQFKLTVFPEIKERFIDTGQLRYTLREFPVGGPEIRGLSTAAFMLARCAAGDSTDRYYKVVDLLFSTQPQWIRVSSANEAHDQLKTIMRQANVTESQYNACITDDTEYQRVLAVADQGADVFEVTGTPTIILNGETFTGLRTAEGLGEAIEALVAAAP